MDLGRAPAQTAGAAETGKSEPGALRRRPGQRQPLGRIGQAKGPDLARHLEGERKEAARRIARHQGTAVSFREGLSGRSRGGMEV